MVEPEHPEIHLSRGEFVAVTSASAMALRFGTSAAAAQSAEHAPDAGHAVTVVLNVNGTDHALTIDTRVTLLDAMRDYLGLTGTKKGCDQGTCGACTMLVNGRRIDSCLTLAVMHAGDRITTIEGVANGDQLHPVQSAFIKHDAFQCGYCTPGQILSAIGMLSEGHPLDRDIVSAQLSGNICRCGCYPHIVDAVIEASRSS